MKSFISFTAAVIRFREIKQKKARKKKPISRQNIPGNPHLSLRRSQNQSPLVRLRLNGLSPPKDSSLMLCQHSRRLLIPSIIRSVTSSKWRLSKVISKKILRPKTKKVDSSAVIERLWETNFSRLNAVFSRSQGRRRRKGIGKRRITSSSMEVR